MLNLKPLPLKTMEQSTGEICDACSKGDLDLVKRLITRGTSPWVRDDHGNTLIHLCCSSYHCGLDVLQYLIATSEIVSCGYLRNNEGSTPLHLSCGAGKKEFVEFLMHSHNDNFYFGLPNYQGETPLYFASRNGHSNIVSLICTNPDYILDPDDIYQCIKVAPNWDMMTILLRAISFKDFMTRVRQQNHVYLVKQIFQISVTIQWKDSSSPPLHQVARSGDLDIVQYLVNEVGCDINGLDSEAYTPLHRAIEYGHLPIVQYLLSQPQCNCETRSNNCGMYPLHHAAEFGYLEIIKALDGRGCDISVSDDKGYTPIHNACNNGHLSVVEYLSSKPQCNLEVLDNTGHQPLHYALCQGHKEIVMLLREKVSVDGIHQCIKSAVEDKVPGSMIELLFRKIGIKEYLTRRLEEDQPTFSSNDTVLRYIIEANCPLHKAIELGCVDVTQYLVNIGVFDINHKNYFSDTLLHKACEKGHFEIVKILTNHPQCNIEAENYVKQRPLHKACQSGNVDIVQHLVVEKGCDVTAKDFHHHTPLHNASKNGYFKILKIMLTNYPNQIAKLINRHYKKLLQLAHQSGNADVIKFITEQGTTTVALKYQQAYRSGEAMLCVVKCILTGPPGAGKSTLKKRLLNESLTEPSLSTGVVDAAIQVNSFRKLQQHNAVVTTEWRTQDLDEEAVLMFENIASGTSRSHRSTTSSDDIECASSSVMTEINDTDIKNGYTDEYEEEGSDIYSDIEVNTTGRQNDTEEMNEELGEEDNEDNNKELKRKEQQNGSTRSHCLPTSSEIIQFNSSSSSNTVTSFRTTNEIDIISNYTCELEEDGGDNYGDIEVNTTKGQKNTEEMVKESEERGIEDNKEDFKEKDETTGTRHIKSISSLSKFVESIPFTIRMVYEERSQQTAKDSHAMLHIIDTGGQPEFHEMLPALITGPAINLLVFDLTIDLTSCYEITYRSSSGDSKPYQTSLTHEEVIFRSLASIACLRQNTIGWNFNEIPLKDESEPAAFLIATHRDCFPNETEAQAKVDSVNNHLKLKIQASGELFREDLVQYSTPDQVIFPLDTRKDQKEIEELRSLLHRVISNKFHELPVPASWCAFSLKLRKYEKPIHLLDTCYRMAQDCGIKDREDFKKVLWFLHHRAGVIMHYPEVEGLGNIVITDLQLVFDRITQLITSCFTFKELGSASSEKEFRDNGRFSESHVKQLSSRYRDPLTPTRLVSLLKHLHIVAGPMKIKVGRKTEKYYFMPCALKPTSVEEEQRDESICPAPLTIYFECGYTPVGVFCCLVVYLLSQTFIEWKLVKLHDKAVHHRNKITFNVGDYYDHVTLISRATYLEVWVDRRDDSPAPDLTLDILCEKIISTLHRGLETVTQSLHYTYKSHHCFGFPCCCPKCHSLSPHPAIVDKKGIATKCPLTDEVMFLKERRHLVWSTKVYSLFPCIHYILCNTY